MNDTQHRGRLQAILIGGTFAGVLSALPLIELGNLCCCLWLVGGGGVASYLTQQNQPHPITPGDGAVVGFLAGVAGAFVSVLVAIPIQLLTAPFRDGMTDLLDLSDVPPEVIELMEQVSTGPGAIVLGFVITLVAGMIFSTLGGLLGAILFRRQGPPPPGRVDIVPPVPPPGP
jgi:hypothetical protein